MNKKLRVYAGADYPNAPKAKAKIEKKKKAK
jgi:hypothetical protein